MNHLNEYFMVAACDCPFIYFLQNFNDIHLTIFLQVIFHLFPNLVTCTSGEISHQMSDLDKWVMSTCDEPLTVDKADMMSLNFSNGFYKFKLHLNLDIAIILSFCELDYHHIYHQCVSITNQCLFKFHVGWAVIRDWT